MTKKSVPYAAYEKRGQMIELLEGDVERLKAELKQANAVVEAARGFLQSEDKQGQFSPEHQWKLEEALAATEQGESDE